MSTFHKVFNTEVNFCPACGSLLPALPATGNVFCLACKLEVPIENFAEVETCYTVAFNKRESSSKKRAVASGDDGEEPTVERRCPKCGHEKMSYAAVQLRSADEGQTVFFTCLKCKFKENENS